MKKLSELLKHRDRVEEQRKASSQPTQTLILFNNVLSGKKLLQSPEIEMLVNYCYGEMALAVVQTEYAERLHDWARDEQYKADVQERAMICHLKAKFEDLVLDTCSNQFSGPLYVQIFHPTGATSNVLTITCCWNDGIFKNDYYVVGVIVETTDWDAIVKGMVQK